MLLPAKPRPFPPTSVLPFASLPFAAPLAASPEGPCPPACLAMGMRFDETRAPVEARRAVGHNPKVGPVCGAGWVSMAGLLLVFLLVPFSTQMNSKTTRTPGENILEHSKRQSPFGFPLAKCFQCWTFSTQVFAHVAKQALELQRPNEALAWHGHLAHGRHLRVHHHRRHVLRSPKKQPAPCRAPFGLTDRSTLRTHEKGAQRTGPSGAKLGLGKGFYSVQDGFFQSSGLAH